MSKTNTTKAAKAGREAKARDTAQAQADRIAAMPPAERQALIRTYEEYLDKSAPTQAAAESDLLAVMQAAGMEFCRRYYPDATLASFHVSKYPTGTAGPEYSVMLPVPVKAAG